MRIRLAVTLAALITLTTTALAAPTTPTTPATPATPAAQPDAASARAYLEQLYHRYEHEKEFGVFGENEKRFFDSSTAALLAQDEKLLNGEEGDIGADYVCVCQDTAEMHHTIGTVALAGAGRAKASVTVTGPSPRGRDTAHVDFDLAYEGGEWRIHDIHPKDGEGNDWGSLRDVLTKEIRALSAGH